MGVRVRVARSRELIAKGRRPAVVARVLQVNRSGLIPDAETTASGGASRGDRSGRPADRRGRPHEPDRRHEDGRRAHPPRARPPGQPHARAAGDARATTAATPPAASPAPPARLLPRRVSRPALAPRHDERLGRRARLDLPECRDRLLHARDRRLVARAALPRRGSERARRRRPHRSNHRAGHTDARYRQSLGLHPSRLPCPTRRAQRHPPTATPNRRPSSKAGSGS